MDGIDICPTGIQSRFHFDQEIEHGLAVSLSFQLVLMHDYEIHRFQNDFIHIVDNSLGLALQESKGEKAWNRDDQSEGRAIHRFRNSRSKKSCLIVWVGLGCSRKGDDQSRDRSKQPQES